MARLPSGVGVQLDAWGRPLCPVELLPLRPDHGRLAMDMFLPGLCFLSPPPRSLSLSLMIFFFWLFSKETSSRGIWLGHSVRRLLGGVSRDQSVRG